MSGQLVVSFKVATTLAAERVVAALSGTAHAVAYPEDNQTMPYGITLDTVLDTTGAIPVALNGIAKLFFNDTVGTGQLVGSDSSGRGIPFLLHDTTTALTLASAYVGYLVGAAVAATATRADVLINPGFDLE